mmetsp:Transcript_33404/g.83910  ORF Transcript_33404/g.83910 Transcript_33404/m.83910 type:complete len:208 (-) Transcript_33404:1837-2460(-)
MHKRVHRGFVCLLGWVFLLDPVGQRLFLEGRHRACSLLGDGRGGCRVQHNLNHAHFIARGDAAVGRHLQVQPVRLPQLLHDAQHLQRQHVLPQVVALLEDDVDGLPLRVRVFKHKPQRQLLGVHVLAATEDEALDLKRGVERQLYLGRELDFGELLQHDVAPRGVLLHLDHARDAHELLHELVLLVQFLPVRPAAQQVRLQKQPKPL